MIVYPETSTSIKRLRHDDEQKTLTVTFISGTVYQYDNVDKILFDYLVTADSIGGEFALLVRNQPNIHPFRKVYTPPTRDGKGRWTN